MIPSGFGESDNTGQRNHIDLLYSCLSMFNQQELQILISGTEDPVDMDDLMQNCIYGGVYDSDHVVIQRFWKARISCSTIYSTQFDIAYPVGAGCKVIESKRTAITAAVRDQL